MTAIPPHLKRAYAHCMGVTRRHYENYPVASWLIPARFRPHVCAVYAFARRADDFADEAFFEGRRLARLDGWGRMLEAADRGRAVNPVFAALAHTLTVFDLPLEPFRDLLSAFRQDVTTRRYDTFDQVRDYARRSANPVGRIILLLFGYRSERLFALSDAICSGLQLANFWQDVAVDAQKDRIYLPREDLARFGVSEDDVLAGRVTGNFRSLMAFEVERTRGLFQQGKALCSQVSGRLALELRAVWLGGMGILDAVEAAGYDVYGKRPVHGTGDRVRFLMNTLVPGRFRRAYEAPAHA